MQCSLQYYWYRASSGVAPVPSNSSAGARTKPVVLRKNQESASGVDLKKHPNWQQRIINVLITKRRSVIAPKSHDNYLVHPNGAFAIYYNFFWCFNFKMYGAIRCVVSNQENTVRSCP